MADTTEKQLTGKQTAWVNDYLSNGFNGTEAARTAGYKGSENTLATVGKQNTRKYHIKAEIARRTAKTAEKMELTKEKQYHRHEEVIELAAAKGDLATVTRNIELIGKLGGLYSDVHLDRTPEQQAEYDEDKRQEMVKLSMLRLRTG